MAAKIPELASLVREAESAFIETYGGISTIAVAAPGRVNIIGEHTDYNDGFVFPMVIIPKFPEMIENRVERMIENRENENRIPGMIENRVERMRMIENRMERMRIECMSS